MRTDELLVSYERELRFIRKLATEFSDKYPQVAARLQLEPTKCEDPHVERLIEAFAMLTARVHLRLDDDFSEVTDALLGILYPHYLRPIPSMTIVQMTLDPDVGAVEGGFRVPPKSILHSRPVGGVRCAFRTAYPLRLFPIEVSEVEFVGSVAHLGAIPDEVRSALRIELKTVNGAAFSDLAIEDLRFFMDAASGDIHQLYELFLRDPQGMVVRQGGQDVKTFMLPPSEIKPVGFGKDEGLLEYPAESFLGYRLLQEYFTFPDKFLFVELGGLSTPTQSCSGETLEIFLLLTQSIAQLDIRVDKENLKLGCTPAVNLFERTADPIRLNHSSVEYQVQPDTRSPDACEVHSILGVNSMKQGSAELISYQSFFEVRHGAGEDHSGAYWHAQRRPSLRRGDSGSEVFISLVDPEFNGLSAPIDVLNVRTLCTNRGLPSRLPFGNDTGDFQLEARPGVSKVIALRKPTAPAPAPASGRNRWRLVSHLSLNYLSIVEADQSGTGEGSALEALREILRLYDFTDSAVTRQRIAGLVGLRSHHIVRRVNRGTTTGFARGLEVDLEFDPTQYAGLGVFLFASILERFLGMYTTVNSFTQTVARERFSPGILKRWAPRAGQALLP